MEMTKAALENERKIQQLQMQAINALWKKVSQMGPTPQNVSLADTSASSGNSHSIDDNNPTVIVQDLAKTCTILTNQVQQLQGSMRDVLNCMTLFCNISQNTTNTQKQLQQNNETHDSSSTQTEIIAVNTPQVENLPFPFINKLPRPSSLLLDSNSPKSNNNDILNDLKNSPITEKLSDSNLIESHLE